MHSVYNIPAYHYVRHLEKVQLNIHSQSSRGSNFSFYLSVIIESLRMPGPVLTTLQTLTHLILITTI